MRVDRVVTKSIADEKQVITNVVLEYYTDQVPDLGLATMNVRYPPEDKGQWALNEEVEEIWYLTGGTATIHYHYNLSFETQPKSAVYLTRG